jgi:hypothetical protein
VFRILRNITFETSFTFIITINLLKQYTYKFMVIVFFNLTDQIGVTQNCVFT